MPQFERYIGIDYSGAATPNSSLKGLRVYVVGAGGEAQEVWPPPSTRKYWSRQGIAHWLLDQLSDNTPTLVGIDHGFSFPLPYFEAHDLALDWSQFLEDFQQHWPCDQVDTSVESIRKGVLGQGSQRAGNPRWRRECERRCRGKSVFHFDVQGSVAKSTHAGLPWLRFLRQAIGSNLHFWPFDGWVLPANRSAILEAYPAIYKHDYPAEDRTPDQQDAYSVAMWLRDADHDGRLQAALKPTLTKQQLETAQIEGWILGVT
jgi:hypothetical protein